MAKKNLKQQWKDMSSGKRAWMMILASAQVSLAVAAWADLASRPADEVKGKKGKWAALIALNYIGPITYFLKGRRSA